MKQVLVSYFRIEFSVPMMTLTFTSKIAASGAASVSSITLPKLKPSRDSRSLSSLTVSVMTLAPPVGEDCQNRESISNNLKRLNFNQLTTVTSIESL